MLQLNFLPEPQHQFLDLLFDMRWDMIWQELTGWEAVPQLRYTSWFPVSGLFPVVYFPFFFIPSFGICLAGASSHGNINVLKTPRLPAQTHRAGQAQLLSCFLLSCFPLSCFLLATGWAQRACRRSQRGCMCLASPGLVLWKVSLGNPIPWLLSIFLCPGSAAKDRVLFPSLSFPSAGPKHGPSSLPGPHSPPQDLHTALAPNTRTKRA